MLKVSNIYGLLTKRRVKMAGYWSITSQKRRGQYQAILTEQTTPIKDLLYGLNSEKCYLRDTAGGPEWAR